MSLISPKLEYILLSVGLVALLRFETEREKSWHDTN